MPITISKIFAASPATLRGQPTPLSCDSKGERIAYASGKSIFLRNIDDPSDSKQYTGHTAATTVAKFSPSGFYVASGDVSGMLRVWDAVGAETTKGEYPIISGRINDVAWDGDSARLIAVGDGRERFGHCVTADSGNSVGEVSGHSKVINAVAIRGMRPLRAATVSDDMAMCFLHGPPFKFATKTDGVHRGFVLATAFSPDGNTLVTVGADKRIQLYDGKTGEATRNVGEGEHSGSIFAVSWAQDSKRFVTASADQTVKMWDVEAGKVLQTWKFGDGVNVGHQQVGVVWPHGRSDGLIISLSLGGDLNYLKEKESEPIRVVQGHNKTITAMATTDNKSQLLTGSFDGRVCTWDLTTGLAHLIDGQSHTNQITQFASSPSGRSYSVAWDDTLRIIDGSATFLGQSLKLQSQPKGVAATASGRIYVATLSAIEIYEKDALVNTLDISDAQPTTIAATDNQVAVGFANNAIRLYKPDGNSLSLLTETKLATSAVSFLSFSHDAAMLAAGTATGKIYVHNAQPDAKLALVTDRWSGHTARVTSVAWNSTGTHAVSGALDTKVHVWSVAKPGTRVEIMNAHKDGVTAVGWVEEGKLASAGGDAAVKVWGVGGLV